MVDIESTFKAHLESQLQTSITSTTPLGRGAHNTNIALHTPKQTYVLRTYNNTQFDNCKQEARMLTFLNGHKAPKVYLVDTTQKHFEHNFMVQEFIQGVKPAAFDSSFIQELAHTIKELHNTTGTPEHQEDLLDEWTKTHIEKTIEILPTSDRQEISALYEQTKELLESMRENLAKYKRNHVIHNDLILDNTIRRDDTLVLIDWEFSRFDYFFIDLGVFISENQLSEEDTKMFLDAYGFGSTQQEQSIIKLSIALRALSHIAWCIERISHVHEGKLDENPKEHIKLMHQHMQYLKKTLKK